MADQVAELTEVRKKLYAAEEELGTAKAALVAVKDGDDAQQIVKAELGVAKAELGVAKAELGVAKAELGVAEAKLGVAKAEWQAAPREEKGALEEIMKTAKKSVESAQNTVNSANIAYENALRAAAPPHGEPFPPNIPSNPAQARPRTAYPAPARWVRRGAWRVVTPEHARAPSPRPHRLLALMHARWGRGGGFVGMSWAVVSRGCVLCACTV